MDTLTELLNHLTDHLRRFFKKIRRMDRFVLAGLATAAVFLVFALMQLLLIVTVRAHVSFDTVMVILTDFAIAGGCVVLALRRDGEVKKRKRANRRRKRPAPANRPTTNND